MVHESYEKKMIAVTEFVKIRAISLVFREILLMPYLTNSGKIFAVLIDHFFHAFS
ncbi:MAG: hypothetical protein M1587_03930 [Thaumarchaeota archaeon]|nr:hypothetical protein [Nitrososphaerota archaeon]